MKALEKYTRAKPTRRRRKPLAPNPLICRLLTSAQSIPFDHVTLDSQAFAHTQKETDGRKEIMIVL